MSDGVRTDDNLTITVKDGIRYGTTRLPSGLVVQFRVPGPYGWASIWRNVPPIKKSTPDESKKDAASLDMSDTIDRAIRTMREFVVEPRIVDLPPSETTAPMVSAWMISDEDVAAFLMAVVDAMGFKSEQAKSASEILK